MKVECIDGRVWVDGWMECKLERRFVKQIIQKKLPIHVTALDVL